MRSKAQKELYLMFALHPTHMDVVFIGLPCPFLEHKNQGENCLFLVTPIKIFISVCMSVCSQHDSYLAVEHLIICPVIQLHSVQVISTKDNRSICEDFILDLCSSCDLSGFVSVIHRCSWINIFMVSM